MADPEQDSKGMRESNVLAQSLQSTVNKVVIEGIGPLTGSIDYAHARLRNQERNTNGGSSPGFEPGSEAAERAIDRIIKESVGAAGTAGFVTGLGGFVTMAATLPANIAGALVINARMVGAIAYLRGYDPQDPHTQAILMLTLVGSNLQSAASAVGLRIGEAVSKRALQALPIAFVRAINKKAGFMLLAKYGTKRSLITLAKGIPFIGAGIGGVVDGASTALIGGSAKKAFPAT